MTNENKDINKNENTNIGNSNLKDSLTLICPYCKGKKRIKVSHPENENGIRVWSDGKLTFPAMHDAYIVQKCTHCGKYYIMSRQAPEETSRMSEAALEAGTLNYDEVRQAFAQLAAEGFLHLDEEANVRMMAIHAFNDQFFRKRKSEAPSQEEYGFFRDNIIWLTTHYIEDGLLRGELLREIGEFKSACELINNYVADGHSERLIRQEILLRALWEESNVFEIDLSEELKDEFIPQYLEEQNIISLKEQHVGLQEETVFAKIQDLLSEMENIPSEKITTFEANQILTQILSCIDDITNNGHPDKAEQYTSFVAASVAHILIQKTNKAFHDFMTARTTKIYTENSASYRRCLQTVHDIFIRIQKMPINDETHRIIGGYMQIIYRNIHCVKGVDYNYENYEAKPVDTWYENLMNKESFFLWFVGYILLAFLLNYLKTCRID